MCSSTPSTLSLIVASVEVARVLTELAADADVKAQRLEPDAMTARQPLDQQHERRLGRLELIALVLQVLDSVEHASQQFAVLFQAVFTQLLGDVGLARQLADQDPALVADGRGVDVLVARRVLADAVDVHSPLVCECTGADKRLVRPEVHVGRLVDVARELGQMLQLARREHRVAGILQAPGWPPRCTGRRCRTARPGR